MNKKGKVLLHTRISLKQALVLLENAEEKEAQLREFANKLYTEALSLKVGLKIYAAVGFISGLMVGLLGGMFI